MKKEYWKRLHTFLKKLYSDFVYLFDETTSSKNKKLDNDLAKSKKYLFSDKEIEELFAKMEQKIQLLEQKEKKELIKSLFSDGLSLEAIAEKVELTVEETNILLNSLD